MIPSYQEEIRIRKNKDRIFWFVVIVMTMFLYFFFQGYYPNYERLLDGANTSKQAFLKPFGIIDIHVFPSPDTILVNNERYNNNSKTIFDLGEYVVGIKKDGYLPITFPIDINKKNPFFTNVVNLFALPEYSRLPINFDKISVYDDFFLLHTTGTGWLVLMGSDFQVIHRIPLRYWYIGGLYFTDGSNIYSYSLDTDKFLNVIDRETSLPIQCTHISYFGEKLFCHDSMRFVWTKISEIQEKILKINDRVIVTSKYIYNQDSANMNWKYFEYKSGTLRLPSAVVHLNKIPYFFENGKLSPVDKIYTGALFEYWLDSITWVKEFDDDTILLWEKQGRAQFVFISSEKIYSGLFDFEDINDITVHKLNGAYVFITKKSAYIYYKGAKEIVKILDQADVAWMVDAKIFFNKEWKSYVVDLLRKVSK